MARFGVLWALAILVGAAFPGSAQDSGPVSRPADSARLIQLLDSDDFATREQATRDLIALGEAGREALQAARATGSLERQMRIAQILNGLTTRAASRPARREPSRVSLEVKEKRLSEVAALLAAQTGYPVRAAAGLDPVVTLSVKDVSFFEAVDLVSAQAAAKFGWDPRRRWLLFEASAEKPAPMAYSGPLRISLVMLNVTRQIRFGGGGPGPTGPMGSANLQIRVDAEERSQALGILMPLKVREIVDDQKRSLKGPEFAQAQSYPSRFDQRRQLSSFIPMALPENDAKAIGRLDFVLPVLLPTEFYEAELQNPEAGSEAGQGEFHVTVQDWQEDPSAKRISLLITRPPLMPGTPGMSLFDDSVTLVGADGNVIEPQAFQLNPGVQNAVYTATVPASAVIASARVSCLKQFETVEFPVVFENVPLP